ncbi:GNAT family N-acetyltransferase [Haloarchaeobius sp. HRN-SO-5]|uniref:GNAT family N-acetyltransferase n=1 Tax=Haloarchaeobius sp. HRN-SO-5 TaxID=3446118 RepID=UPI003EB8D9D8
MADHVTIRETTAADARAVQSVADASRHAAYDAILGVETVDDIVTNWYDPDRVVADDVAPDDRPFFVAVVDDEVVGYVEGVPDGDDPELAHLYRIYVHPDHWGVGVGRNLLDRLETAFSGRGFERLRLSVFAENDVGVQFYESVGFDRVDATRDEQFGVDRYEYAKRLP